jgi:hypothetical protein
MGDSPHAARLLKCLQRAVAYERRVLPAAIWTFDFGFAAVHRTP